MEMLSSYTATMSKQIGLGCSTDSLPTPTMSFLRTVPENTMVAANGLRFNVGHLQDAMQDESPKTCSAQSDESEG